MHLMLETVVSYLFDSNIIRTGSPVFLVKLLHERSVELGGHGSKDAKLLDGAVENLLDGCLLSVDVLKIGIGGQLTDGARNTDKLGHGRGATRADGSTVLAKGGGDSVLAAVLVLDLEQMLQELNS